MEQIWKNILTVAAMLLMIAGLVLVILSRGAAVPADSAATVSEASERGRDRMAGAPENSDEASLDQTAADETTSPEREAASDAAAEEYSTDDADGKTDGERPESLLQGGPESSGGPASSVSTAASEETSWDSPPGTASAASSTPVPTPTPMWEFADGRYIMLSITETEFLEYVEFFRRELNLNDAAIAGIIANLQYESGFNPNKVGDMGNAYGLCQWRGARLDQMVSFCEENDLNPVSRDGQLAFLAHDLKENYIYAYDLIRLCPDSEQGADEATYYFCAYYEVPTDADAVSVERQELTELLIYPRLVELSEAA